MTELHSYDPWGAATKTPEEACEQAFRRGANHALQAALILCEKYPGRELEIVQAAAAIAEDVRGKWPKKWGDWYMHRLVGAVCKKLDLKPPIPAPGF